MKVCLFLAAAILCVTVRLGYPQKGRVSTDAVLEELFLEKQREESESNVYGKGSGMSRGANINPDDDTYYNIIEHEEMPEEFEHKVINRSRTSKIKRKRKHGKKLTMRRRRRKYKKKLTTRRKIGIF